MSMDDSISMNGLLFIVYMFIMIVVFYVLGGPVDTIFDSFTANPVVAQQATMIPYYKIAVRIAFAIGITTPVFWFIAKMFSREPAYYQRRRL